MKTDVFRYALSIPELRNINVKTKNNAESKGKGEWGKGKGNLRIKCMGAGRIPAKNIYIDKRRYQALGHLQIILICFDRV